MFHDSEDFFNLFLTLAMLELGLDDVVLLILGECLGCSCRFRGRRAEGRQVT